MLTIRDLSVDYGGIEAVRHLDLDVPDGHLVSLVGANGAGKSSTLNAVAGLVRPRGGRVLLDDRDVTGLAPHILVRAGIALVPEGRMVADNLTVWENLSLSKFARRLRPREFDVAISEVLELFPILSTRRTQLAGLLSGGEQQMLAIARALLTRPTTLLLDEPSMGLSPSMVGSVFDAIGEIHRQGMTVLLVEQNAEMALSICTSGVVLQRGERVLSGTGPELLASESARATYLS